jgi:hypothetical protein
METQKRHLAQARTLRARADECRRIAEIVTDPDARSSYVKLRSSYVKLADSYELLANHEAELAIKIAK